MVVEVQKDGIKSRQSMRGFVRHILLQRTALFLTFHWQTTILLPRTNTWKYNSLKQDLHSHRNSLKWSICLIDGFSTLRSLRNQSRKFHLKTTKKSEHDARNFLKILLQKNQAISLTIQSKRLFFT